MTLLYLVRHAAHARQEDGTLIGRSEGIGLGAAAPAQLDWLRRRLAGIAFDAVLSSPRLRTVETARAIAREPEVAPELDEVDFGAWTGRAVRDLAEDAVWQEWNRTRSTARAPGGETMLEIQSRIVGLCERLCRDHPRGRVLLVSHADVLRSLLLHGLGASLDGWSRLELEPGSVSVVEAMPWGVRILRLNETGFPV